MTGCGLGDLVHLEGGDALQTDHDARKDEPTCRVDLGPTGPHRPAERPRRWTRLRSHRRHLSSGDRHEHVAARRQIPAPSAALNAGLPPSPWNATRIPYTVDQARHAAGRRTGGWSRNSIPILDRLSDAIPIDLSNHTCFIPTSSPSDDEKVMDTRWTKYDCRSTN